MEHLSGPFGVVFYSGTGHWLVFVQRNSGGWPFIRDDISRPQGWPCIRAYGRIKGPGRLMEGFTVCFNPPHGMITKGFTSESCDRHGLCIPSLYPRARRQPHLGRPPLPRVHRRLRRPPSLRIPVGHPSPHTNRSCACYVVPSPPRKGPNVEPPVWCGGGGGAFLVGCALLVGQYMSAKI